MGTIGLGFSIGNFNRSICTKGKKARIIRSIDASETSENSRVMPGYGEMCSEANLAVRFTKSEAKNQKAPKSMLYLRHRNNKPMDSKMSCYQLSDKHHASIAHFVWQKLGLSAVKFQQLADKLKRCNIESVNYRYDQKKPARKCKTDTYKQLDAQSYYDAIRCWAYQSGDDPYNLDYDILHAFLFSLVPDNFSPEMSITEWGIY